MYNFQASVILSVAFFILSLNYASCILQNFTFYAEENCAGGLREIVYSSYDSKHNETIIIPVAKSAQIFGMWWYLYEKTTDSSGAFGWIYADLVNPYYGSSCNLGTPWARSTGVPYKYLSVSRIGPSNIDRPALTLYPGTNFQGHPIQVESRSVNLKSILTVKSLVFTGKSTWTLYPKQNYLGSAIVVGPTALGRNTNLQYLNSIDAKLTVGSVKIGAGHTKDGNEQGIGSLIGTGAVNSEDGPNYIFNTGDAAVKATTMTMSCNNQKDRFFQLALPSGVVVILLAVIGLIIALKTKVKSFWGTKKAEGKSDKAQLIFSE